ncbi:MFS transporter [Thalassospira tepidiphila]|uniref:MFS transporter n=2 Tax=Thalassospira tepidiphila TaxID=393657 RepID=A0A853L0H1_9PROT|nr:MFS transporter [Thalassospira tepidiphila]NJB75110.1 YNFM family putative membrane transporter [Thalassospira tepidiphila]OAZ10500.1 MFS transporter [Thalassospira tepidiphila MCCC 1A03514]
MSVSRDNDPEQHSDSAADTASSDATPPIRSQSPLASTNANASADPVWIKPGSAAFRRISIALFLAGYATFSLIYCVQPLLPELANHFVVGPAESSLALSLTTGFLAFAILLAGAVSEAVGRKQLMLISICVASVLNLIAPFLSDWHAFLVVRALEGLMLGGVPAVAMAYLAEEIDPKGLGMTMGIYISGTAIGGLSGRVVIGFLTDLFGWHVALGAMGALGLIAALGFAVLLPASRNFVKRPGFQVGYHLRAWGGHLKHAGLPFVFLIGAFAMGCFVTVFNYVGFRLSDAPYGLSQSQIGLIFVVYLCGSVTSSIAGALSDKIGRGPVLVVGLLLAALGVGLTVSDSLSVIIGGIVVLTSGFFVAHSIASGWVGRLAETAKGHASSLYLLAYYLGSSIMGSVGGWFWDQGGWNAVAGFAGSLLLCALLCGLYLWGRAAKVVRQSQTRVARTA